MVSVNAPATQTTTKSAARSAADWPAEGGPVVVCVAGAFLENIALPAE